MWNASSYWAPANQKTRPLVLASFETSRHPRILNGLKNAGLRGAYIVHDLIPIRNQEFFSQRSIERLEKLFKRLLTNNDPIITVSNWVKRELIDWGKTAIHSNYIGEIQTCQLNSMIPEGRDWDETVPELEGQAFAVFCSSFSQMKRHDLLVNVWSRIAIKQPNIKMPILVLVGRRSDGWPAFERALAAAPHLEGKVLVFSNMGDAQLNWCYRNAAFTLFPSTAEGWDLGISESLAFGTPVFHTNLPTLIEAAQNLMPNANSSDIDEWVDMLTPYLVDQTKLQQLRQTIADEYLPGDKYSFPRCVVAFLEICYLKASIHEVGLRDRK